MKILMIAPEPFFEPRGTPISVYSRLHMLTRLNYEIDLLTYPVGQDVDIPGVTIHRTRSFPFIDKVRIGPSWPKLLLDILLFVKAFKMLATRRYDVIHSHEEAAFFCVLLAWIFGVRHIYDMHSRLSKQLDNFKFGNYWPIIKLFEVLERVTLATCQVVITVGNDLEEHVKRVSPGTKCVNIENIAVHEFTDPRPGHNFNVFKTQAWLEGRLLVVYTGTLEHYQGMNLLFDSVPSVRAACPNALIVIVGGSEQHVTYWRNYAKKLDIEDDVVFVGQVSLEESLAFLDIADILVSSRIDGTSIPLKIYSYIRSGKPILATNISAHIQILTEDVAYLVEPNVPAFAQGLKALLQSSELRQRLATNARLLARDHMANQASKLHDAYQSPQSFA